MLRLLMNSKTFPCCMFNVCLPTLLKTGIRFRTSVIRDDAVDCLESLLSWRSSSVCPVSKLRSLSAFPDRQSAPAADQNEDRTTYEPVHKETQAHWLNLRLSGIRWVLKFTRVQIKAATLRTRGASGVPSQPLHSLSHCVGDGLLQGVPDKGMFWWTHSCWLPNWFCPFIRSQKTVPIWAVLDIICIYDCVLALMC
ncbi:hypothetical protein DFH11DRAFT_633480 [Phellopilus nigrolimitatus]|nr:hypothetical protein DFH11DRAFT_633480 [Phellopilus nigrolimitatus]